VFCEKSVGRRHGPVPFHTADQKTGGVTIVEDFPFSPELERLEHALAAGPGVDPPDDLRRRVIADVRAELRRERVRGGWAFAAAVAATVALWMNLSLSATQATDYGLRCDRSLSATDAGPSQLDLLRELLPQGE
jgi:hypothetical protein